MVLNITVKGEEIKQFYKTPKNKEPLKTCTKLFFEFTEKDMEFKMFIFI